MKKKSIWRLIVGVLLVAAVSNSLRHAPQMEPGVYPYFLGINLLLVGVGVWLAVSYFRRSS